LGRGLYFCFMNHPVPSERVVSIQETTDAAVIHQLAHEIWPATYRPILSPEQITYMLKELYSPESLLAQMTEGQTFLLLQVDEVPVGFAAYSLLDMGEQLYKLNKIYLHPGYQGQGLGKLLLQEVTERVAAKRGIKLELNVHRQNPAQHFYSKFGFKLFKIIDIPFGPFVLNDYILRLNLPNPE
jgi:ribosomal protein S18 acetylase RimI-like enzyme